MRMNSVVLLNSYSMRRAFDLWQAGRSQAHHVWGFAALARAADLEIRFDDAEAPGSALDSLLRRLPLPRTVQLQLGYLFRYRSVDAVYAATYSVARLLGMARAVGLFRPKVIALAHFPLRPGLVDRLALRGIDRLLFLSHATEQAVLHRFPAARSRAEYLGWAADLQFYAAARQQRSQRPAMLPGQLRIVAAGKDNRDYETFMRGLAGVPGPLQVDLFCTRDCAPASTDSRVKVHGTDMASKPLPIQELLLHYAGADVMVIPMLPVDRVAGLTSLIDAFALGMPVLCTRNAGLDFDIEAIGCGFWVEAADPAAWAFAIGRLPRERVALDAMGQRGRQYAERHLDMDDYSKRVGNVVRSVLGLPQEPGA